jgi:biopolymer transport protein ExbB/TolQ
MSEVLQANIFFMITSIAVVVVTILVAIGLYHMIRILRAIRRIAERVEEGSKVIGEDVAQLRSTILNGNIIANFFSRFMPESAKRKERRTRKAESEQQTEHTEESTTTE